MDRSGSQPGLRSKLMPLEDSAYHVKDLARPSGRVRLDPDADVLQTAQISHGVDPVMRCRCHRLQMLFLWVGIFLLWADVEEWRDHGKGRNPRRAGRLVILTDETGNIERRSFWPGQI